MRTGEAEHFRTRGGSTARVNVAMANGDIDRRRRNSRVLFFPLFFFPLLLALNGLWQRRVLRIV